MWSCEEDKGAAAAAVSSLHSLSLSLPLVVFLLYVLECFASSHVVDTASGQTTSTTWEEEVDDDDDESNE